MVQADTQYVGTTQICHLKIPLKIDSNMNLVAGRYYTNVKYFRVYRDNTIHFHDYNGTR